MQIIVEKESSAKLEDILEQLQIRYDLEDLSPDDLIEALIDLAYGLMSEDETANLATTSRFIDYCSKKLKA